MTTIVVTGIGATSPIGGTARDSWTALLSGASGARTIEADWVEKHEIPVTFAAQALVRPEEVLERQEVKRLDPSSQFALIAAREAWADAGSPEVAPERILVDYATGIGGLWTLLDAWDTLREKGPRRVSPFFITGRLINLASGYVSIQHGLKGPNHSVVTACSTGAHAIGDAARLIMLGDADVMVAGGAEAPISEIGIAGFNACKALSTKRGDEPQKASRPYDSDRDGFVMGEGAGCVVLEEYEHAKARGAKIYCEVLGYGLSGDAYHITAPAEDGDGGFRSMSAALKRAGGM